MKVRTKGRSKLLSEIDTGYFRHDGRICCKVEDECYDMILGEKRVFDTNVMVIEVEVGLDSQLRPLTVVDLGQCFVWDKILWMKVGDTRALDILGKVTRLFGISTKVRVVNAILEVQDA